MRYLAFSFLILVLTIAGFAAPASAQPDGIQLAQAEYRIWKDRRGRTFLVDPYTGEIVREVFRERQLSRRERRLRRQERRSTRIERELGRLFDLERGEDIYEEEDFYERRRNRSRGRNRRRNRDRYLDDYDNNPTPPPPLREAPIRRGELPQLKQGGDSIARLPERSQTLSRSKGPTGIVKPRYGREKMAALQVVLDRAGFSPGVIDGKWGSNVANAMAAWKEARGDIGLGNAGTLNKALTGSGGPAFYDYTLTTADVAGPFVSSIPVDYARKAQLERLAYTSAYEKIAEKFHMSEAYLRQLNPGKNFGRSGTRIRVAAPGSVIRKKVHYIVADKGREQVRAYDRNGKLVTAYPATIGSASTPSPSGTHTVERVALNPDYTYNPKKNFQQGENDKILTIPPGPNGPVGSVWIALSKPTYGIHGTPNPDTIGKTNSHGCIRLTNWDAQELAKLVSKGVTVEFFE